MLDLSFDGLAGLPRNSFGIKNRYNIQVISF